jgi:hypothetical protein
VAVCGGHTTHRTAVRPPSAIRSASETAETASDIVVGE